MIRFAPSLTRVIAPAAAVVLSASALAACGSSSSSAGTTPSTSASTSASSSMTMPMSPTSTGGSGNIALCSGLTKVDLGSLSQAKDMAGVQHAWAQFAANAPDAIKPDVQAVSSYLQAAINHDYTALQSAMGGLQTAITHITTYIAANCHG